MSYLALRTQLLKLSIFALFLCWDSVGCFCVLRNLCRLEGDTRSPGAKATGYQLARVTGSKLRSSRRTVFFTLLTPLGPRHFLVTPDMQIYETGTQSKPSQKLISRQFFGIQMTLPSASVRISLFVFTWITSQWNIAKCRVSLNFFRVDQYLIFTTIKAGEHSFTCIDSVKRQACVQDPHQS